MSIEVKECPVPVLNDLERDVHGFLSKLPCEYKFSVLQHIVRFRTDALEYAYEPDFSIQAPDGRQVFVEVRSRSSLTLENLARFKEINEHLRHAGYGFVVIVPDAERKKVFETPWREFSELPIVFCEAARTQDVVVNALKDAPEPIAA